MHQQPNPPAVQITDYLHSHPDCSPDILFCAEVIVAVHITAGDSQHQGGDRAACQADFTGIGAAAPSHCILEGDSLFPAQFMGVPQECWIGYIALIHAPYLHPCPHDALGLLPSMLKIICRGTLKDNG